MKASDSIASILHSRSQSTSGTNDQRHKIVSGEFSVLDKVFPLLDEMLKTGKVPSILESILFVHIYFQIFAFSLWPAFTFLKLTDRLDDTIGMWIYRIAFISEVSLKHSSIIGSLIFFSILILIFLVSFGIELFVFFKTRRFNKPLLHVARTCFDVIPMLILLPISEWTGICLKYSIKMKTTFYIVCCVIAFIYLIIVMFAHHVQSYFTASLPYIPTSNIACWSGYYHFMFLAIPSVILIVSFIADFFPKYFMLLLMFFKILYNIYMVYNLFFFPFSHLKMNDMFAALFMAVNVLDVIKMLDLFNFSIHFWILLVASISSFVVCLIISKIIFYYRIKLICSNLTFEAVDKVEADGTYQPHLRQDLSGNAVQDEKIRILFHRIGLDKSENRCEMYFRIGLANRCPLFLNWALVKYASEYHRTAHMSTIITQMLSFYPCEARLLSSYFNTACTYPLNFTQRFLMFQINIIKQLRQSSASREIGETIIQLKNKANTIIDDVRKFWTTCPDEMNVFYDLQKRTQSVRELFDEALNHYPNNVRICEGYSQFLIEGAMDFKEGVRMKHKADLIEQGKNFVIDFSFRSLVRAYPEYLKKNIMNVQGQFIQHNNKSGGSANTTSISSSSSKNSNLSTGTIDGILDPEIEEQVAKNCFTYHRLRLEFQGCMENRKIKYNKHLHWAVLWSLLCVVILSVFFFVFYYNRYDQRLTSIQRLINLVRTKYNIDATFLASIMKTVPAVGAITPAMIEQVRVLSGSSYEIDVMEGDLEVARWSDYMTNNLSRYMNDIMGLAQNGVNVETTFTEFVVRMIPIHQCNGLAMMPGTYNETLKELFVRLEIYLRGLHTQAASELVHDDRACETIANFPEANEHYRTLASRILAYLKDIETEDIKINTFLNILIPLLYAFVSIPPIYFYLWLCLKELRSVHGLLVHLNQSIRETASKSLLKTDEEITFKETMKSQQMLTSTLYAFAALPIINAVLFLIVPMICVKQNTVYNNYNYWVYYSSARASDAVQALIWSIFSVAIGKGFPEFAFNRSVYVQNAQLNLNNLIKDNNDLLRGSDKSPSCVGRSDNLDRFNIVAYCKNDDFKSVDHSDYKCSSLDASITSLFAYLNLVLDNPQNATMDKDTEMANSFHIVTNHIVERCWESSNEINSLAKKELSNFRRNMALIAGATILVSIIITIILWVVFSRIETMYNGELQLLRRVPPLSMSSSPALMNYITHKDEQKKTEVMAPTKSIVYQSKDSIIFINKNLNIESINNATTDLFGYTPDQILGQPINTILAESINEDLYKQVEMMKTGQCALVYEHSCHGITDDEQDMPVHITLIGIPENNGNLPKAFVVIMRNETELIRQRKIAETAKAQSEKLLYQILPRDIVTRLNRGETDINFTVPSATIIFIDIVKFSNYASTLTPAEIMEHLSIIFAKFDAAIAKFNLLTKIKLIGDVYMAAGGLFTPEENPQNHAVQMINFALESLMALEEANNQFNASLMVRIGVNTNGPLIAGVLGTDKPVFDIIGDPINVASRLQSTAVPGTVQISEETFQLIANMNYNIEKRGEIELKGKGKKTAYVVRPLAMSSFFSVPQDLEQENSQLAVPVPNQSV